MIARQNPQNPLNGNGEIIYMLINETAYSNKSI